MNLKIHNEKCKECNCHFRRFSKVLTIRFKIKFQIKTKSVRIVDLKITNLPKLRRNQKKLRRHFDESRFFRNRKLERDEAKVR